MILVPALRKAKESLLEVVNASRQRNTCFAVMTYSQDNNERYPQSIARPSPGSTSPWKEPTILAAPGGDAGRTISSYLRAYIERADILYCPRAPGKAEYIQDMWDSGDDWDSPSGNQFLGAYCFYWNYIGHLDSTHTPFLGPSRTSDSRRFSTLLTSDYLGFGHWRNVLTYGSHNAYGSCCRFNGAQVTKGTPVSADFWSRLEDADFNLDQMKIQLQASYTDGHVEKYTPSQVTSMKVSRTLKGTVPCPPIGSAGTFYIPDI